MVTRPTDTRQPMNVDPEVRDALTRHLFRKYAGTGVGFSEWIRQALLRDGAPPESVPEKVQPDNRWSGQ